MRSPGITPPANGRPSGYSDQANQDWGHHEFVFGLVGHAGDWRKAQTDWQAYRLNDPLIAFQTAKHKGTLGKSFSLVHLNNSRIRVLALKKAEASDEIILRMVELDGKDAPDVLVSFAGPIARGTRSERSGTACWFRGYQQAANSKRPLPRISQEPLRYV